MADTHPEALRVFLDLNHRLPVERKVAQIVEMYETRRLGREIVKKAYGWAPGE
jgi:hypothetical protein